MSDRGSLNTVTILHEVPVCMASLEKALMITVTTFVNERSNRVSIHFIDPYLSREYTVKQAITCKLPGTIRRSNDHQ